MSSITFSTNRNTCGIILAAVLDVDTQQLNGLLRPRTKQRLFSLVVENSTAAVVDVAGTTCCGGTALFAICGQEENRKSQPFVDKNDTLYRGRKNASKRTGVSELMCAWQETQRFVHGQKKMNQTQRGAPAAPNALTVRAPVKSLPIKGWHETVQLAKKKHIGTKC